jgi:hypothetical protein
MRWLPVSFLWLSSVPKYQGGSRVEYKNIIVEIRAGTGGEEAALFAAGLGGGDAHFDLVEPD